MELLLFSALGLLALLILAMGVKQKPKLTVTFLFIFLSIVAKSNTESAQFCFITMSLVAIYLAYKKK